MDSIDSKIILILGVVITATVITPSAYSSYIGIPSGVSEINIFFEGNWFNSTTGDIVLTNTRDISWSISSLAGSFGEYYFGGFYQFGNSINDFNPSITFGNTNSSHTGHLFIVTGVQPSSDIVIEVTGIRVEDENGATPNYTATITIPNGTPVNSYFETTEKFIGQVTIETISASSIDVNYGFSKYWDDHNSDFIVTGIEFTWLGAATDDGMNMNVVHHTQTGWTYSAGGQAIHSESIAVLQDDHGNSGGTRSGESGAWKHTGLDEMIDGSGMDGILFHLTTTSNNAIRDGTMVITINE